MKKQKLKTHKGAKRRFKVTATGKIMRTKGMKSHFRRRKSARVKRQFDRMLEAAQDEREAGQATASVRRLVRFRTPRNKRTHGSQSNAASPPIAGTSGFWPR